MPDVTSSRTALVMALALLLSAGCSYSVNGDALPEAGVTSTTSVTASAAPRIAKPRTVVGVEPCSLLTAADLLARRPDPSRAEIRAYLSGNYCRCTGYQAIVDAIVTAAARLGAELRG